MYCSGQVPFLPSLSLKILVGEGRIPGQARSRFSLLQQGFFWKVLPIKSALVLLLCSSSRSASFGWFCSHVPRRFYWQIRPALFSLWGRTRLLPSLPRRVFLIIFSRLIEPGDQARPGTHTLRGLLPINCFQPGPCTTKPRLQSALVIMTEPYASHDGSKIELMSSVWNTWTQVLEG